MILVKILSYVLTRKKVNIYVLGFRLPIGSPVKPVWRIRGFGGSTGSPTEPLRRYWALTGSSAGPVRRVSRLPGVGLAQL